jgi:hypothetical protein
MGKPSIYSKTRTQLRSDLAQASANSKPKKRIDALSESIDTRETNAKSIKDGTEVEAV